MLETTRQNFWAEEHIISPEEAQSLLDSNNNNRDLSPRLITRMARDLTNGAWAFNGESLKFDRNGQLVDGQHRLNAIIVSQKPMRTVVCGGLDPEIFSSLDSGKKRNLADLLKLAGVSQYGMTAATTNWVIRLKSDDPLRTRTHKLSERDRLFFYEERASDINRAVKQTRQLQNDENGGQNRKMLIQCPPGLAAGLRYVLNDLDEDAARNFFRSWNFASQRADLATNSYGAILADQLASRTAHLIQRGGRMHDSDRLLMIVTTWNHYIRREKLRARDLSNISIQDPTKTIVWPGILGPVPEPIDVQDVE